MQDEDEDEEDDEDELDMDFKMVFVINRSLEISPGQECLILYKLLDSVFIIQSDSNISVLQSLQQT